MCVKKAELVALGHVLDACKRDIIYIYTYTILHKIMMVQCDGGRRAG